MGPAAAPGSEGQRLEAMHKIGKATGWRLSTAEQSIVSQAVKWWPKYVAVRAERLAAQESEQQGKQPAAAPACAATIPDAAAADEPNISGKQQHSKLYKRAELPGAVVSKRDRKSSSEQVSGAAAAAGE